MLLRSRWDKVVDALNIMALALVAAVMLFPFLYIFSVSFSSLSEYLRRDVIIIPQQFVLDAYRYILGSMAFKRSLVISAGITVVGTLVNLLLTTTMAYALSRPIYGQRVIMLLVLFTLLFSAGLVPTYLVVKATRLIDSYWALILPVAISPFNLIVMRQFFLALPEELLDAAVIDGANELQIFWHIILPISKPALAAIGLFYAVGHWNNYFSALLYLNDSEKWPIQVVLRQIVILNQPTAALGQDQQLLEHQPPPETIQMAAILLSTVPILIVYPFLQRYFAKGVLLGSVKG